MAITFTDSQLLKMMLGFTQEEDLVLKLYKNKYTPHANSKPEDFIEADFPGYHPVVLETAKWNEPSINEDGKTEISYQELKWKLEENVSTEIYGYIVVSRESGNLVWAERFAFTVHLWKKKHGLMIAPRLTAANERQKSLWNRVADYFLG